MYLRNTSLVPEKGANQMAVSNGLRNKAYKQNQKGVAI